jgi:hypothetical protein
MSINTELLTNTELQKQSVSPKNISGNNQTALIQSAEKTDQLFTSETERLFDTLATAFEEDTAREEKKWEREEKNAEEALERKDQRNAESARIHHERRHGTNYTIRTSDSDSVHAMIARNEAKKVRPKTKKERCCQAVQRFCSLLTSCCRKKTSEASNPTPDHTAPAPTQMEVHKTLFDLGLMER